MIQESSETDRDDERAVSPVIGVILMVAITVILAAVIGTFVLDLGQSAGDSAPQVSLSVDSNFQQNNISISHTGGETLDLQDTKLVIRNESSNEVATWERNPSSRQWGVGDTLEVSIDAPTPSASKTRMNDGAWGSASGYDESQVGPDTGEEFFNGNIAEGIKYTVQIIDVESGKQVFSTTFTA